MKHLARIRTVDGLFWLLLLWSAVASGMTTYQRLVHRSMRVSKSEQLDWAPVANWQSYVSTGYRFGDSTAANTIVVFSDFQCPYCRAFATVIDSLRAMPNVRVVERNFPLEALHPAAMSAAIAGECSKDIGLYPAMRHAMFSHRGLTEDGEWGLLSVRAGVRDSASFVRCVTERRHLDRVQVDLADANKLGLNSTPSVIVNGFLHRGIASVADIKGRLRTGTN